MENNHDLIYEDHSTLRRLKSGDHGIWALLLFLGIIFIPVIILFLFITICNPFPNIPQYTRLLFAWGAIFIGNIILTCIFHKPIKIYRTGIDLGTLGSIGTAKALVFGIVYYFIRTKYLPWSSIESIRIGSNSRGAPILEVLSIDGIKYLCTLGDLSISASEICEAVNITEGKDLLQTSLPL